MEMVKIMEHRALKCPLVLYIFFLNFLLPRRLNREFKAFKRVQYDICTSKQTQEQCSGGQGMVILRV